MTDEQLRRFLLRFAAAAAALAIGYCALRYLLRWTLPFLIALSLCSALEPCILFLERKLHFRRGFSSALLTLFCLFLVGGLLSFLFSTLFSQATSLLRTLPQSLSALPDLLQDLLARFEAYCALCPQWLQDYLYTTLFDLVNRGSASIDALAARLLTLLASFAAVLPRLALGAATTVLAVFYTSASYPTIRTALRQNFSHSNLRRLKLLRSGATQSLARWLRAELALCTITFCQLFCGFLFLRQEFSLLLAFLITLVDALPVLGAGVVLVPWALATMLFGATAKGILLLALYLCTLLVRNTLEPKFMAKQAGLPPVASLAAMYLGFCLFGVGGMILFPFLLLFFAQLYHLTREDAAHS